MTNGALVCAVTINSQNSTDPGTISVTWNGVSMFLPTGGSATSVNFGQAILGLINPANGSNTLQISWQNGATAAVAWGLWSFSGADQGANSTTFINAIAALPAAAATNTKTITTVSGYATAIGWNEGGTDNGSTPSPDVINTNLNGTFGLTNVCQHILSTSTSDSYTLKQLAADNNNYAGLAIKSLAAAVVGLPFFVQDIPYLSPQAANIRRQLDAFAFTDRFAGTIISSIWPWHNQGQQELALKFTAPTLKAVGTNQTTLFHSPFSGTKLISSTWPFQHQKNQDLRGFFTTPGIKAVGTNQVSLFHSPFKGTLVLSIWPFQNQKPEPETKYANPRQPPWSEQQNNFVFQSTVPQPYGGAFSHWSIHEGIQQPKKQWDQLIWHSPFAGTALPTSFPYQLQQDTSQLPKKQWDQFTFTTLSTTATPSAFGYQLQQDIPQLPKKQLDQFAFHTPYGLYFPSFPWQLQQDIPQLPKKQLDQFAFSINFSGTLTPSAFGYQLQQDVPQLPKKQLDQFSYITAPTGVPTPSAFGYQLQQDVPQLPKKQWDQFSFYINFSGTLTPAAFGYQLQQDVKFAPKQQNDTFAFHSPFFAPVVTFFPQLQQDIPQLSKKQLDQFTFAPFATSFVGAFAIDQLVGSWLPLHMDAITLAMPQVTTVTPSAFGYQLQQDIPQPPKKQLDQFSYITAPTGVPTPSAFGYQLQQDTPQLQKQQNDQFVFRITFSGTLTPTQFGYQLQQDIPQLPKKQWDQFALHSPLPSTAVTPSYFPWQLQQDVPQLPKQQRDQFAFHTPYGLYVPSFSWQLQQDIPQPPKKQWDQFTAAFISRTATPSTFGSFTNHPDVPQLPKQQRDVMAFHSPFSGIRTPGPIGYHPVQYPDTKYPDWKTVLLFVNAFNGQVIVQATVRKIYSYITSAYIQ